MTNILFSTPLDKIGKVRKHHFHNLEAIYFPPLHWELVKSCSFIFLVLSMFENCFKHSQNLALVRICFPIFPPLRLLCRLFIAVGTMTCIEVGKCESCEKRHGSFLLLSRGRTNMKFY